MTTVFRSSQMALPTLTNLLTITGMQEEMPRIVYKKGDKEITLLEIEPTEGQKIPKKLTERNVTSFRDHFGKTVLIAAAEKDLVDIVKLVVSALEQTPLKRRRTFVMTSFNAGYTALDRAKSWESFEVIAQAYNGSTSWPKKSTPKQLTLCDLIGYTQEAPIRSKLMDTVLQNSSEFSKKNTAFTKAMLNTKNHHGEPPLFRLARLGAISAMQPLIAFGADVNAQNKQGQTPLHIACSDPKLTKTVKLLLQNQAIIDLEDQDGKTPFNIATETLNADAVTLLVTHSRGKRIKVRRRSGSDPSDKRSPSKTSIPMQTQTTPGTEVLVDSETLAELKHPLKKKPPQSSEYSAFGGLVRQQSTPTNEKEPSKGSTYGSLNELTRTRATSLRQPNTPQGNLSNMNKRFRRKSLNLSPSSQLDPPKTP